jgi:hypothetical protein
MSDQHTAASVELEGSLKILLEALRQEPAPITAAALHKKLRKKLGKTSPLPEEQLSARLEELLAAGLAHSYAPKTKAAPPRYWTQTLTELARRIEVAEWLKQPVTTADFTKRLKARLKGFTAPEVSHILERLLAERRLYRWPKSGKLKERVGLTPPAPQDYLDDLKKPLTKPLAKLQSEVFKFAARFEALGVPSGHALASAQRWLAAELALPALSSSPEEGQQPEPLRQPQPDLPDLIFRRIVQLEPAAANGAPVSVRALRRALAAELPDKQAFDRFLLQMAREYRVDLQRHDFPGALEPEERQALVADDYGNFYIGISLR